MARTPIHKLLVNQTEFDWIVKTVHRKAGLAQKMEKNDRLKNVMAKFADKFATLPMPNADGLYVVDTNRNEIRILQEIVKNEHAAVMTRIIPGYEEKMRGNDYYRPYFERAIQHSLMLTDLSNKIARVI